MANETVTNLSTILEYLFTRYGRPENIATQALEELQSKKPPSQNLEDHLIDIKNLFSYIIYENQQHLVTNEVSLKISQGIFPETERKDFVKRLIEHKNEAQKIFLPSSTYEHFSDFYNKTKGLERVNLFVEFINDTTTLTVFWFVKRSNYQLSKDNPIMFHATKRCQFLLSIYKINNFDVN